MFSFGEEAEEEVLMQRPVILPTELASSFHKSIGKSLPPSYCEAGPTVHRPLGIDAEKVLHFRLEPGVALGLQLAETSSGTKGLASLLVVKNMEAKSPFAKTSDRQLGIAPGDVIVEANGRRGTAAEVRGVLQQAVTGDVSTSGGHRDVTLVVRPRPCSFDVEMLREGPHWETLGITVVIDKTNPGCALVQSVKTKGLVPDWNKTHGSLRICGGDLITQVNDLYDDATDMCQEIQEGRRGSVLRFRVCTSIAGQSMARRVSGICEVAKAQVRAEAEARARADFDERVRAEAEEKRMAVAAAKAREREEHRRLCAESAERLHSGVMARGQGLRQEVQAFALDAIAWDVDEVDSPEAPPPLASPVNGRRPEMEVEASGSRSTSYGSAGRPPALDDLGSDGSEAAGLDREDSADSDDDTRIVLTFSPGKRPASSRGLPTEQFVFGCQENNGFSMPSPGGLLRPTDGESCEEESDLLSEASTDITSGERTPPVGNRRAAWV